MQTINNEPKAPLTLNTKRKYQSGLFQHTGGYVHNR